MYMFVYGSGYYFTVILVEIRQKDHISKEKDKG